MSTPPACAAQKQFDHPHVLKFLKKYETRSQIFLVLEYVDGGEMFDYLVKNGRRAPARPPPTGLFGLERSLTKTRPGHVIFGSRDILTRRSYRIFSCGEAIPGGSLESLSLAPRAVRGRWARFAQPRGAWA